MKYVPVSLTEELVLNYSALPKELDGWRYYRCEYNSRARSCVKETHIYLPAGANPYVFDVLCDYWQEKKPAKRRKILREIIRELELTLHNTPASPTESQKATRIPSVRGLRIKECAPTIGGCGAK